MSTNAWKECDLISIEALTAVLLCRDASCSHPYPPRQSGFHHLAPHIPTWFTDGCSSRIPALDLYLRARQAKVAPTVLSCSVAPTVLSCSVASFAAISSTRRCYRTTLIFSLAEYHCAWEPHNRAAHEKGSGTHVRNARGYDTTSTGTSVYCQNIFFSCYIS